MSSAIFGQPVRLRYLEARLFTDGHINATRLRKTFGTTRQQASTDIRDYLQLAGPLMRYNASKKSYVLNRRFTPKLMPREHHEALLHSVDTIRAIMQPALYPKKKGPASPSDPLADAHEQLLLPHLK